MFKSPDSVIKKNQDEMIALLQDKQTRIEDILQGFSFTVFGNDIPDTAPGMAAINIIIADGKPDYMRDLRLQKQLTELLKPYNVNIYTPRSLNDTYKNQAETILTKAKTLAVITGQGASRQLCQ